MSFEENFDVTAEFYFYFSNVRMYILYTWYKTIMNTVALLYGKVYVNVTRKIDSSFVHRRKTKSASHGLILPTTHPPPNLTCVPRASLGLAKIVM